MQRIKAIFFLILFGLQMMVFTVEKAFCSDKLVNIEFNGEQKVCACGHDVVIQYETGSIAQKPCCSSDTVEKSSDILSSSELPLVDLDFAQEEISFNYTELESFIGPEYIVTFSNPPPVKRKSKAFILFQNFKSALVV